MSDTQPVAQYTIAELESLERRAKGLFASAQAMRSAAEATAAMAEDLMAEFHGVIEVMTAEADQSMGAKLLTMGQAVDDDDDIRPPH